MIRVVGIAALLGGAVLAVLGAIAVAPTVALVGIGLFVFGLVFAIGAYARRSDRGGEGDAGVEGHAAHDGDADGGGGNGGGNGG